MNDVSSEDEDDEETEKSVILSNGNRFNVNPGSATGEPQESCFEEEKEIVELQGMESGEETVLNVDNSIAESDLHQEKATKRGGRSHIERVVVTRPEAVHGVGKILPSNAEVSSSRDSKSGVDGGSWHGEIDV